jgi:hypothetical protein
MINVINGMIIQIKAAGDDPIPAALIYIRYVQLCSNFLQFPFFRFPEGN